MKLAVSVLILFILAGCGSNSNQEQSTHKSSNDIPTPSSTKAPSYTPKEVIFSYPQSLGVLTTNLDNSEIDSIQSYLLPHYQTINTQLKTELASISQKLKPLVSNFFTSLSTHKELEARYLKTQPSGTTYNGSVVLPAGAELEQHKQEVIKTAVAITQLKTDELHKLYQSITPDNSVFTENTLPLKFACAVNHLFVEANKLFTMAHEDNHEIETTLKTLYSQQNPEFQAAFQGDTMNGLLQQVYLKDLYTQAIAGVRLKHVTLDRFIRKNLNEHFFEIYEPQGYITLTGGTLSEAGAAILNNTLQNLSTHNIKSSDLPLHSYNAADELDLGEGEDEKDWFASDYLTLIHTVFTKNPSLTALGQSMLLTLSDSLLEFSWNGKDIVKKQSQVYRDGESSPISDSDAKKVGIMVVDALRTDALLASVLKDPHQTDAALRLSARPTLRFMTQHTSRAMRLNAHSGFVDFSDFNYKQQHGALYALQSLPLSIELTGNYNTNTKYHLQLTSFYHIGNMGIGIKGGHSNTLPRHSLTQAQNEASLSVFYNSPNHWFVEASAGYTSIDHAVLSTATGTLQNLTIGYDSLWVTPFISASQRQLSIPTYNKQIIDYKITAGLETAKLQTQYGTHTITHHATFSGSYLPGGSLIFQGSFESSLLLQSGVWIKSNLGLSTNYDATLELQFTLQF